MQYYFIYSAGGGAGDWNGIKRVWKDSMPPKIKKNILLKFGDIFFNHKSSTSILRSERWNNIKDIRKWLYENVNDDYVINESNILLDSGTAKIVSFIDHNYNLGNLNTDEVIKYFKQIVDENNILEKYAEVIVDSNINLAVTFDIPDPFKVRSNNNIVESRRNILESNKIMELMDASIEYTNKLYSILEKKIGKVKTIEKLMPIVNGNWTKEQYDIFIKKLIFEPINIAIGGISGRGIDINSLDINKFNLEKYNRVHFLGCGGLSKTNLLKENYREKRYSVDVSTPINRAIDGAVTGTSYSGVYSYNNFELIRICKENKEEILIDYKNSNVDKVFPEEEFEQIINKIIQHQEGNSNEDTYNNRAKLIIINSDVFRYNAEL